MAKPPSAPVSGAANVDEQTPQAAPFPIAESDMDGTAFDQVCTLICEHTGHDFSHYKKASACRRIERRMAIHRIESLSAYELFMRANPQEVELLFKELLIGVTSFFRDQTAWRILAEQVVPEIITSAPRGTVLRGWVAGCSTGEEAYSLAMVFSEVMGRMQPSMHHQVQIFATDLDSDAIAKARQGFYPANIADDVSADRLARFFVDDGSGYRIGNEIRRSVVFAQQDLITDPPFTKLDILICRNLLIYLGNNLQDRLLPLFHYCIKPDGILMLGSSESIGSFTNLFAPLDGFQRLFRRNRNSVRAKGLDFPTRHRPSLKKDLMESASELPVINLKSVVDQLLLSKFSPAAVLVSGSGDLLYVNGRTGKYLEPAAGKVNWNIHAMARDGLRQELALGLSEALRTGDRVTCPNLAVETPEGPLAVNIEVHPILQPAELRGTAIVIFTDAPFGEGVRTPAPRRGREHSRRVNSLEQALGSAQQDLLRVREEMQSSQEELQSANEELQSANEELQSTNEELQSTNEELSTSREEMQSLNEEMQTVNVELQSKVDELISANNDIKSLLNSIDIITIFLDRSLYVRRFTTRAAELFNLIPGDIGRPLSDIVNNLAYPDLLQDARQVLRTLIPSDCAVPANDGRWFQVRIMPFRTLEHVIAGVVIILNDISRVRQLEEQLSAFTRPTGGLS